MKLWQCDWVPSSVADWLCRELDDRGIPGTTYTHTLLSLLHPYFCPHPVPKDPGHLPKSFINFECVRSILNSGQPQQEEFEVLFEELEDHVHPDADFPELKAPEILKEGTRRSKKRQKRKQNQQTLAPEKIWKVAALQCLWTASDETNDLETVIEELFLRLKKTKSVANKKAIKFDLIVEHEKTQGCYSSNFPPLNTKEKKSIDIEESALNWKSLIKDKLSPEKQAPSYPARECRQPDLSQNNPIDANDASHSINIDTCEQAVKDNLEMEIRTENVENGDLENKAYCFIPILRGEKSVFDSEMHFQDIEINADDDNVFKSLESQVHNPEGEKGKIEEWECAGSLLAEPVNRAVSVDVSGNRLYERTLFPAEAVLSNRNSDVDVLHIRNEDKQMHEGNVENPDTSFWSYASESWKKPRMESVWDSASFTDSGIMNMDKSNSVLLCEREENYIDDQSKFEPIQSKNQMTDNWASQNWNSFSLINPVSPKMDHVFHSQNIFEENGQNSKISSTNIINENLKNIWSDLNDNITMVNTNSISSDAPIISPTLIDFDDDDEDKNEGMLCRSFKQLGLKHLWEDALLTENISKEPLLESDFDSPTTVLDNSSTILENETLISEENYSQCKEDDNRFLLPKIPCGPSGPYVELKHTESSGFTAVIPQDKNLSAISDNSSLKEELIITPKDLQESASGNNLTAQEEENLLTSPRTHFRPIRQDSHGSVDDAKLDEGQAILNVAKKIQNPDLVFQRSGSGTLYLESDLLTGSPKKYMAYREPVKIQGVVNPSEVQNLPELPQKEESPLNAFVPKFKLINNEKFCQTEGPDESASLGESIGKELESKILQHKLKKFEYLFEDADKNWEVPPFSDNMKIIWEENSRSDRKEAWELGPSSSSFHYPKWSTQDLIQTNWSNKQVQQQLPMQDAMTTTSFEEPKMESNPQTLSNEDTLSKIKFIWHSPKGPSNPVPIGKSAANSMNHSVEFPSSVIFPESWDDKRSQKSSLLRTEPSTTEGGLVIPKSPWNMETTDEDNINKSLNHNDSVKDAASRWQLQWEVDQEADEILGGLLPPSPLKSSPPYNSPLKNPGAHVDLEEFSFLDFLEGQDQPPIEDLDNLEPGWDLNEGFEWGPATEELFQGDDDEDEREVLVYENEDGQTVLLPVEYLEDSLYDQIFGSVDTPIGGSLPDLPGGSEFKKGSLSLKLSRRSRGDKFVPPSRRPCSFFLEGNCRRSDCKFSHDLLTITCRFWEEGSCLKGDTCPFRHGFPPSSRRRNRSEGDQSSLVAPVSFASLKEGNSFGASRGKPIPKRRGHTPSISSFELDSETDFPCLGSSVESKLGSLDEQSFSNLKVTKLSKKKKKFITISKTLLSEIEHDGDKGTSKRGRRSKGARSISIDVLSSGVEGVLESGTSKKKGKDLKECESLRKILRKRYPVPPSPPFSHEDGTLSDF